MTEAAVVNETVTVPALTVAMRPGAAPVAFCNSSCISAAPDTAGINQPRLLVTVNAASRPS